VLLGMRDIYVCIIRRGVKWSNLGIHKGHFMSSFSLWTFLKG
jgi:hypothetical protein